MHYFDKMIRTTPPLLLLLILLAIRPAVAQKIIFTPQWIQQSQFVGYYAAEKEGFYTDEGAEVEIIHPSASNNAIHMLKSGKANMITMMLSQAMKLKSEGLDIVNVMQTSQRAALVIVSREPLNGIQSLNGKKIGRWAAGHDELAQAAIKDNNLNVEWIPFLSGVNLFLSGAIDATLAMSFNEYYRILETGHPIHKEHEIRLKEIGYDVPEDGVYALRSYYEAHKEEVAKFVRASQKGWQWASQNRKACCDMVMEIARNAKVPTSRYLQEMMLQDVLSNQIPKGEYAPSFVLKKEQFDEAVRLFARSGYLTIDFSYGDFVVTQ